MTDSILVSIIWSIRLHMQTMKTPVRNRIFVRLSGSRRMPVKIVVYSDLTAAIVAVWRRSDLTAVGSSPPAGGGGDGTRPHSGQVRVPLPKTRHEDAEVTEAKRRTLPKQSGCPDWRAWLLASRSRNSSPVPRARSAKTLAYFRFYELLAALMVNIWPRAPWQEGGRSASGTFPLVCET